MAWHTRANSNQGLIAGLMREGIIRSPAVEQAMLRVDRGLFCPVERGEAYHDNPVPIGFGQTISAPHMHAEALEVLQEAALVPDAQLLDVGSGSGYFAALLSALNPTASVVAMEIVPELVQLQRANLARWNPDYARRIDVRQGSGWEEVPGGPFDAIHVGAAAATLPASLVDALRVGGRLLIPLGAQYENQVLALITKMEDGTVRRQDLLGVRYVPLVKSLQ